MSKTVLVTINAMMKYSNGVETTIRQILYFIDSLSLGMYLSSGFAWMAKSMHDFCGEDHTRTSCRHGIQSVQGYVLFPRFRRILN
jgi:hypothetical protein